MVVKYFDEGGDQTNMTRQELIKEFKGYPASIQSELLRELRSVYDSNLTAERSRKKKELSVEARHALVKSLSGSVKMKHPPMTKKEVRDLYYGRLNEKDR